jgi:hypothetical protein
MNQAKQGSAFLSVSRPVGSGFHFSSDFCDTEQIQLQVFALRTSGARKSCATTQWIDIRVPISVSRSNAIRRLSLRLLLRDSHWSRLCSPATTRRSTIPLLATTRQDEIELLKAQVRLQLGVWFRVAFRSKQDGRKHKITRVSSILTISEGFQHRASTVIFYR